MTISTYSFPSNQSSLLRVGMVGVPPTTQAQGLILRVGVGDMDMVHLVGQSVLYMVFVCHAKHIGF